MKALALIFVLFVAFAAFAGNVGTFPDGAGGVSVLDKNYTAANETNSSANSGSQGNYLAWDLSLTEMADVNDVFTASGRVVCYGAGQPTINVEVSAAVSFERTIGSGNETLSLRFGIVNDGIPADANGFGEEYQRSISAINIIGMGAMVATTTMVAEDCISIMHKTTAAGTQYLMHGASIHIREY